MSIATVAALVVLAGGWIAYHCATVRGAGSETARQHSGGKAALGFARSEETVAQTGVGAHVETIHVESVPHRELLHVTGTLSADQQSVVASNTNGIVSAILIDRGSVVKKGDVLVELDPTDAQNHLDEGLALVDELKAKLIWSGSTERFVAEDQPEVKLAKATLQLANSRLKRAEALLPKSAISTDDYEMARSEAECAVERHRQALEQVRQNYQAYRTAVAKLAALRKGLADDTIRAPFDGIVVEKDVNVGEQVTGGFVPSKVITMVKNNPVRLGLTVPQQSIGQIHVGQKVFFHVDSYPGKTFEAAVRYISPSVASDTRSLLVEAVADNAKGTLDPGLFITAELELSERQQEILVPMAAVQKAGEVARVLVVHEGAAREQVVALGEEVNGKVEVRSGLNGDETLVARPDLLHDGDTVRR